MTPAGLTLILVVAVAPAIAKDRIGAVERNWRGFCRDSDIGRRKGIGSRRKFVHEKTGAIISLHKPHLRNELKAYQVRDVLTHLKEEQFI
jgi:hypothetical protein